MPLNPIDDFFFKDILIQIIPKISLKRLDLIEGSFGPFLVGRQTEIPIWLADLLCKSGKCTILAPECLSCSFLEQVLAEEQSNESLLSLKLPKYFFHLSKLFLDVLSVGSGVADSPLENPQKVRILVQDIQDLRLKKIHTTLLKDLSRNVSLSLDGITQSEISQIRPFLVKNSNLIEKTKIQHDSVVVKDETLNSQKFSFGNSSSFGAPFQ